MKPTTCPAKEKKGDKKSEKREKRENEKQKSFCACLNLAS